MEEKKKSPHKYVTLLVMFDAVSDPRSFRLKVSTLRVMLGTLAVVGLVLAGSLIYYFSFAYKVFYYDELERKYEKLAEDNTRIKQIEREYRKVKQENEKIRIVFGLLKNMPRDTTYEGRSTYENFTAPSEMGYYPGKDLNDPMHEKMAEDISSDVGRIGIDYLSYARVVPTLMPVNSRFIARGYQDNRYNDPSATRIHRGVDIVAEEGAPVKAASEGRVIVSEWFTDYGNTIVLYHGFGFFSVYKHLQFRLKETDDAVKTGEVIGTVGKTGRLAKGIHLHFEIWRDGVPRDPATFIPQIRDALVITVKADSLAQKSS